MKRYSQEFNKRINAVISLLNEFKIKNYEFLSNLYNFIFRLKIFVFFKYFLRRRKNFKKTFEIFWITFK